MYFLGHGVKQDLQRAAELLKAAAEQGHSEAQFTLTLESYVRLALDPLFSVFTVTACLWASFSLP